MSLNYCEAEDNKNITREILAKEVHVLFEFMSE